MYIITNLLEKIYSIFDDSKEKEISLVFCSVCNILHEDKTCEATRGTHG